MILTVLTTVIGFATAALCAQAVGGSRGAGIVAGFVAGTLVAAVCVGWQRNVVRTAPERALNTLVLGFLVKLAVVVVAALAFVVSSALRETLQPGTFLLAFGGASLCVLLPGTVENARLLRGESARLLRERRVP